jgi:hypothetical protein
MVNPDLSASDGTEVLLPIVSCGTHQSVDAPIEMLAVSDPKRRNSIPSLTSSGIALASNSAINLPIGVPSKRVRMPLGFRLN